MLLKGLIKPFKDLIRPFKSLISPLKGLIRPFKGLIRPLKGLLNEGKEEDTSPVYHSLPYYQLFRKGQEGHRVKELYIG